MKKQIIKLLLGLFFAASCITLLYFEEISSFQCVLLNLLYAFVSKFEPVKNKITINNKNENEI